MKMIAHRGASFLAPENTMAAFKAAIDYGAHAIELDIRRTKDGKIVVAHDLGFERVMCGVKNRPRQKYDLRLDEILQLKLPYAGQVQTYMPSTGFLDESDFYPFCLDCTENIYQLKEEIKILTKDIVDHEKKTDFIANYFYQKYQMKYEKLLIEDCRFENYISFEQFLEWLKEEKRCEFVEVEFKDNGLIEEVNRLIEKYNLAHKCLVFRCS